MDEEIRQLFAKTARTRYEFLVAEVKICTTTIDFGQMEVSRGNIPMARHEADVARRGIETMRRFLPEVEVELRTELEEKVSQLEKALGELTAKLE